MNERLRGRVPVFFELNGQIAEIPRPYRMTWEQLSELPDKQARLEGWLGSYSDGRPEENQTVTNDASHEPVVIDASDLTVDQMLNQGRGLAARLPNSLKFDKEDLAPSLFTDPKGPID